MKYAIEFIAAGGHNILLLRPPESGKSAIAERIPSFLPLKREHVAKGSNPPKGKMARCIRGVALGQIEKRCSGHAACI